MKTLLRIFQPLEQLNIILIIKFLENCKCAPQTNEHREISTMSTSGKIRSLISLPGHFRVSQTKLRLTNISRKCHANSRNSYATGMLPSKLHNCVPPVCQMKISKIDQRKKRSAYVLKGSQVQTQPNQGDVYKSGHPHHKKLICNTVNNITT